MSSIDLRNYVVAKWGSWYVQSGSFCPDVLRLASREDGLSLAGPLRVRISVIALNNLTLLGTSSVAQCEREAFGYVLDIPPGQTWSYPPPQVLPILAAASGGAAPGMSARTLPADAKPEASDTLPNAEQALGTNAGFGLAIRLAGPDVCSDPCASDPCGATTQQSCSCGCSPCKCPTQGDGLPCNFAQRGGPNWYFPSACEPCTPGAVIGVPASTATALLVPPATGGTVRTRYFNGMFITREDLETDQRNVRLKRALMNRAMGQGVAWGLEVSSDGNAICVLPGYGVDCCGNDLVLSAPYRVDVDALVRDPGAAAALGSGKAQQMSLVLEYFECPEQPRPVHGDPCSTDVTRCETSRIRETVRLRLAPPREVDDSGCIKDFLSEIEKLRCDPTVGPYFQPAPTPAPAVTPLSPPPLASVPFQVQVTVLQSATLGTGASSAPSQPSTTASVTNAVTVAPFTSASDVVQITASFPASNPSGFTFVTGTPPAAVVAVSGSPDLSFTFAPTSITWSVNLPLAGGAATYQLQNWRAQDSSGNTYAAPMTQFDLSDTRSVGSNKILSMTLTTVIGPSTVKVTQPAPPAGAFPCLTEACDPSGAARFKVAPPWLHQNPEQPGKAVDPQVLVLALTYAFIAGEQARLQPGAAVAPRASVPASSSQLDLAQALYNAVFKATFATAPVTDRFNTTSAIQKLLQCWCRSLLYPGPKCLCSPHGVVVGCARVEGGRVTMVDSWGGRRWIVHYPLLAYWGQQFGIMPPDAIASRLFDMICCIACLPGASTKGTTLGVAGAPAGTTPGSDVSGRTAAIPLGSSTLIFDDAKTLSGSLSTLGVQTARTQTVSPVAFAMKLWDIANGNLTATASAGTNLVDYVPLGFPDLHLLSPDAAATPATSASTAAAATRASSVGSLDAIVSSSVAAAPQGSAPPPLLRSFTTALSKQILAVVPLEATDSVQHAAADALANVGLATIADLLSRDPEALLQTALKATHADGLNGLIAGAEATARAVASDVSETTAKFAAQASVTARADLTDPTRAANLSRALADRLSAASVAVTPEIVGRAVKLAATGS